MKKTSVNLELAGKKIILETGQLATQATASVLARLGDTEVLAVVVEGKEREEIDYFPLRVEYIERLYAGGRIKGSRWVKREGRPSDEAILTARFIDRSIRPLFPKEYKKEVQVVVNVLSVDGENEPDILSVIAVSAALSISNIPWEGPIGTVRVGFIKEKGNGQGKFLINPSTAEIELSDLDIVVSQIKDKTLMVEAGALQASENTVLEAIKLAQEQTKILIKFIEDFATKIGQKKSSISPDPLFIELTKKIEKSYKEELSSFVKIFAIKDSKGNEFSDLIEKIFKEVNLEDPESKIDKKITAKAVEAVFFKIIRENILKKDERPDGRKLDEIREISAEVSFLPRTHGSAIFQRGNTQCLTVVTLGSPKLEQLIESAEGEESKRYIHHYSMPPYSVGETGRIGTPSRREIGHGALAERALLAVIPNKDKFPYTIRVVSEVMSSNGSTSMASACGSSLALMDAGVPIEKPVAGIAIGMISNENSYKILTDIIGLEDFSGDMDFKIAGTDTGITAIQLDVKNAGLTIEQIGETFERAREARLLILEKIQSVLPVSREHISEFAPKVEVVNVPVEKIGDVIGSGGRTIKSIIAQTGASVDVEDDGKVTITAVSEEAVNKAAEWVRGLTREVVPGEVFDGTVKRILPFGAFVEILPSKEGMVHVSQMSTSFVKDPSSVVSIGDKVKVRVVEVDDQGRINLSMLFGEDAERKERVPDRYHQEIRPHPLTMQFRRERMEKNNRGGNPRIKKNPRFR